MTAGPAPFALRDYALLADGERGALLGPHGEMAWMCFPSWDSPSVFSSLLGGPGSYQVSPDDRRFVWGGYYDRASLIWNSRWVTTDALIECREAMVMPTHPTRAVILRRIKALRGRAQVTVRLQVAADYGRRPLTDLSRRGTTWFARGGGLHVKWSPGPGCRRTRSGELLLRLDLAEGDERDLVLELDARPVAGAELRSTEDLWTATEAAWAATAMKPDGLPAARDAAHAYAVMRGLTAQSGAMVAAATTSLPERAAAGRNYDYRYAWIRDQCFAGEAAATVKGAEPLVDASVRFVTERLLDDGPDLKPAYRTTGEPVPDEEALPHLPGYPGGQVKVGNRANTQFQLDALGESLLLLAAAARADRLDRGNWKAAEIAVDAIATRWDEPDAGIWELDDRWWSHSRLVCVAGLRQIAACAAGFEVGAWTGLADSLLAETGRTCMHPSGRWQRAADDDRVDASYLFCVLRGAVPVEDPRTVATVAAIENDLCRDGYLYRFRHDERPLEDAEGAFSLCGFALAMAYCRAGLRDQAVSWFERTRASCGPPGLLTEEFDVGQRQLRGNVPQAFVHAMLLECAARLAEK